MDSFVSQLVRKQRNDKVRRSTSIARMGRRMPTTYHRSRRRHHVLPRHCRPRALDQVMGYAREDEGLVQRGRGQEDGGPRSARAPDRWQEPLDHHLEGRRPRYPPTRTHAAPSDSNATARRTAHYTTTHAPPPRRATAGSIVPTTTTNRLPSWKGAEAEDGKDALEVVKLN